jgi:TrpR-related protein YerC/YecD
MKKRWVKVGDARNGHPDLFDAVSSMRSSEEVRELLLDLCTPAELEALMDRWRVVPHLVQGTPYREIHDLTAVSVTTIGRVARCLNMGEGGYQLAAKRLQLPGLAAETLRLVPTVPRQNDARRESGKGKQK